MSSQQSNHIEVEFERTVKELVTAQRYLQLKSPEVSYYRTHLRLLMTACALLVGDLFWRAQTSTGSVIEGIVAVLLGALVVNWTWRSYSPRDHGYGRHAGHYRLAADERGLTLEGSDTSMKYAWTAFTRFSESRDHLFLFRSRLVVQSLPKSAFRSDQFKQFRQLVSNCIGSERKCSHCGYSLTGNVSGVCPECGRYVVVSSRAQ